MYFAVWQNAGLVSEYRPRLLCTNANSACLPYRTGSVSECR